MQRRHHAIPLQQAVQESPNLALLVSRLRESSERLQTIRSLLPAPLKACVQAGPIEDGAWCLLVNSNAVAAKLRQLVPALQAHLNTKGMPVNSIRIKVQSRVV
ncbi:DciA family protein [Limnohabitans sp. DM1]|uniref:DciA family protein n=1 Tax=Limnohabitans sp. DM1 TaxID=1597955 RepID=UPI000A87592F|nr:DciA family protein [Limnohabitans sp. DM1]